MAGELSDRESFTYDVFISYRRGDGRYFANWLRGKLIRYRLPRRLRARGKTPLRAYQDVTFERVTDDLWENNVKPALLASRYLAVVITPSAFLQTNEKPSWVEQELREFLELPQKRNVFVVQTRREGVALPADLRNRLSNIIGVDIQHARRPWTRILRQGELRERVRTVAASLYDIAPEEMPLLRLEEERAKRNIATAFALVAFALLAVLSFLGYEWRAERRTAVARQLAAQSAVFAIDDPSAVDKSAAVALESLRRIPTMEADRQARIWARLLRKTRARIVHEGGVLAMAVSSDGRYLATGGRDSLCRLTDFATGRALWNAKHGGPVRAVAFSDGSGLMATGSDDHKVRVFRVSDGKLLSEVTTGGAVIRVTLSPNGQALAISSDDHFVRLYRVSPNGIINKNAVPNTNKEHVDYKVAFSPDGNFIVIASPFITDVFEFGGKQRNWYTQRINNVNPVIAISNDSRLVVMTTQADLHPETTMVQIAEGSDLGSLDVRELATGKVISRLKGKYEFNYAEFSPDGKRVATGGRDDVARVFDAATGKQIAQLIHGEPVRTVHFSPDGERVATASEDHTARIFDAWSGTELARLPHSDKVINAVFDLRGHALATASLDGNARIFNVVDPTVQSMSCDEFPGWCEFSPDGRYLAMSGASLDTKLITRVGLETLQFTNATPQIHLHHLAEGRVAISQDQRLMAVGTDDGMTTVLDARSRKPIAHHRLIYHNAPDEIPINQQIKVVSFSQDGRYVASASWGGDVSLIEARTGRMVWRFRRGGSVLPFGLVFSPDGHYLAAESVGPETVVYDLLSGQPILHAAERGASAAPLFTADSRHIVIAFQDKSSRFFDLGSGTEQLRINSHDEVAAMTFTPDGQYLLTASLFHGSLTDDWPIKISIERHALQPDVVIEDMCGRLSRNLTPLEWQQLLPDEAYDPHRPCQALP